MERWSEQKAWEWYNKLGWVRGCNFIGSDCCNRIDMWQSYKNDERMETADKELALCEKIGFNSVRLIVDFEVWLQEPESYMAVLEKYLTLAAKHKQSVMFVLAHEAQLPRGIEDEFVPKKLGEQVYALGYHQGRGPLAPAYAAKKPYHFLERDGLREKYLEMVREIVGKYKNDPRIFCWNVYNEPGITIHERAVPLLDMLFEEIRKLDPIQPLTADIWKGLGKGLPTTVEELHALELSDVISFHHYGPYIEMVALIDILKKQNRPMFCTEWLNRLMHNDVKEIYPLFFLENIGCYCWGFVVGKTQTNEPWEDLWKRYYDPNIVTDYDFTKWQHDLFRPSLRPYDPKELEIIEKFDRIASEKEAK